MLFSCSTPSGNPRTGGALPPLFEVYPEDVTVSRLETTPEDRCGRPMVAIIIDDIGYNRAIVDQFLSLEIPLSFSVFPHSPDLKNLSQTIRDNGHDLLLHLPMEPIGYPRVDPGPDALTADMSPQRFLALLEQNLDSAEAIQGVNNHMGSRLTTMPTLMNRLLSTLKKRNLFFIDSVTTGGSVGRSAARLAQIPFAHRDVFLDHDRNPEAIRREIRRLIRIAQQYGEAVGIGHPHPETFHILKETLPLLRQSVRLVPASDVVHVVGY